MTARRRFDRPELGKRVAPGERKTAALSCGHDAKGIPELSNPDRWWCCGAFQKKKR
jgi:hypothetical protein